MARKQQKGLSYFPFNINFFDDKKIEMINAEFGVKGENIAIRLLCEIYKEGYWMKYDEDVTLLIAKRVGNGVASSLVGEVVNGLVKRSFFNKGVFDSFSILTSKGIQERFFEAIERRKKIEVIPEIMLIDINATFNPQNVTLIPLNVALMGQNVTFGTQSKVKETKGNESKGEETIPPSQEIPPSPKNEEKKEEPPIAAAPPLKVIGENVDPENQIALRDLSVCHKIYWGDLYGEARRVLAYNNGGMSEARLLEWAEAFNRRLVSEGVRGKSLTDYTSHFSRWLNREDKSRDPKNLYNATGSNNNQGNRTATGANVSTVRAFNTIDAMYAKDGSG